MSTSDIFAESGNMRYKMRKLLMLLFLVIMPVSCFADNIDYDKIDVPVEIRGMWVDAGAIPKTPQGIRQLVRSYHDLGINVLFPEIVARGYTVYCSKLIARDPRFAGCIDPLPIMIKEAHALGMEVHPWVWVFRAGYTKDRGAILTLHPDWAEKGKNGEELSPNGGMWISPAVPAARDFMANLFKELVTNYDVDGIHLDYIRYEVENPMPYGYSEASRAKFESEYGIDPLNIDKLSQNQYNWQMFRERLINTFVQRIALQTRAIKPHVIISAAVGSDPKTARTNLMQNWQNWIDNKWVDFVTPMAYTDKDEPFANLVKAQKKAVGTKTLLAPGIGLHLQKDTGGESISQIAIARKLGADGEVLFSSSHLTFGQQIAIDTTSYPKTAALPFRNPACQSKKLFLLAEKKRKENCCDEANYYSTLAQGIKDYADYKSSNIGYVSPTKPPLNIPDNVIPVPSVSVTKTASSITIDGNMNEDAWKNAAHIKLQYDPEGDPVSVDTTAYVTYDSNNLYVAFKCEEPETNKIKESVVQRDGPTFYDDSVEIFVAPTANRTDYYHLSTNTIGTMFDQKVMDPSWNASWKTATKVGSDSWTTEFAIPFNSLGVSMPTQGSIWTINFTRNRTIDGNIEYITWAVPYGSFHTPDRFGIITFK